MKQDEQLIRLGDWDAEAYFDRNFYLTVFHQKADDDYTHVFKILDNPLDLDAEGIPTYELNEYRENDFVFYVKYGGTPANPIISRIIPEVTGYRIDDRGEHFHVVSCDPNGHKKYSRRSESKVSNGKLDK